MHQNRSQILEKSTENSSQIVQKSIEKQAWRGSGRILAPKRVLRGVQGDFEPVQNGFYTILAANIGPPWDPGWYQVKPQIVPKSMSKSMNKIEASWDPFLGKIWMDFG